ncbi:hypothetical protein ACFTTN_27790 [Streptomyces niveus]
MKMWGTLRGRRPIGEAFVTAVLGIAHLLGIAPAARGWSCWSTGIL